MAENENPYEHTAPATLDHVGIELNKMPRSKSRLTIHGTGFVEGVTPVKVVSTVDGGFVWTGKVKKVYRSGKAARAEVSPDGNHAAVEKDIKNQTDQVSVTVDNNAHTTQTIDAVLYSE